MTTIHQIPATRKSTPVVVHYAVYGDVEGTATLVNGSGYLFRKDGERQAMLMHYTDPDLYLFGLVADVEAQRAADKAAGGRPALVCNPEWRLSRER